MCLDVILPLSYVIPLHLRRTCVHHVCTMRNPCPLTSSPNPNSISRLFPILLDPKSFQTALDYSTWLPGYVPISYPFVHCRLIITIYLCPANPNPSQSLSTLSYYNTRLLVYTTLLLAYPKGLCIILKINMCKTCLLDMVHTWRWKSMKLAWKCTEYRNSIW